MNKLQIDPHNFGTDIEFSSENISMKKQIIIGSIAAGVLAIGGIAAYFIKRHRDMAAADNTANDMVAERKPRKHITEIFRRAKANINGHHEPVLSM